MKALRTRQIEVDVRYQTQQAFLSIQDIFDAVVELVTNADDRYQHLAVSGVIEIEVQRQRLNKTSILRVRDFADGMTDSDMVTKLGQRGGRVSGLEAGEDVRGTNSRGAKDVAALGRVTFDSIAADGNYHRCQIEGADFTLFESQPATSSIRANLGLPQGTGTLVTIEVEPRHRIPQHENLVHKIESLVPLREILRDHERKVVVRDLTSHREDVLTAPKWEGKDRAKKALSIPGFPDATAKLMIKRGGKQFDCHRGKFRQGAIIVQSKHAVHEATLFDDKLDHDLHAAWFFGRLVCPYIDKLWNDYDDAQEKRLPTDQKNPMPVFDPGRRAGLTREHPFVQALFGEALKVLRPLVEEERKRAEGQRASVENRETRKRLDKLEDAAAKFMEQQQDDEDFTRDANSTDQTSRLKEKGYSINPPFIQIVAGQSQKMWLNVHQNAYPELSVGATVQIHVFSDEIECDKRVCGLEEHPTQSGVLRALWTVKALAPTPATGVRVRCGSIVGETLIEVFATPADKYNHVDKLMFSRKQARVTAGGKKKTVVLLAPIALVPQRTKFEVKCDEGFEILGQWILVPSADTQVAQCRLAVRSRKENVFGTLTARVAGEEASIRLQTVPPKGSSISIKVRDIDLGNQRYMWRGNTLELQIAARHPSLARYLGRESDGFPGQEKKHFRLLLAEIVGDAVCGKIIERREKAGAYDDEQQDWNQFYAEFSSLMTRFLPTAHKLVLPDAEAQ